MHVFKVIPSSHGWKIAYVGLQFQFRKNVIEVYGNAGKGYSSQTSLCSFDISSLNKIYSVN